MAAYKLFVNDEEVYQTSNFVHKPTLEYNPKNANMSAQAAVISP